MNLQLTDKIAIITGGTRGIGAGIARVLAAEGVHLALAYRSDTEGALCFTRELTEQYGIQAHAIKADVTIPEEVEAFYQKALALFPTVHILINNAAGGTPENTPMEELSFEQWKACMNGCLSHVFTMSQAFVKECKKSAHGGHIVNVSAKAAFHSASHNKIPYATAKGAIATLTQRMANDLIEDDIFVNAIVPGYVLSNYYQDPESPQCKAKEKELRIGWATPEDMGNITAFLCSPLSRQIIGAVIDCSGGTML